MHLTELLTAAYSQLLGLPSAWLSKARKQFPADEAEALVDEGRNAGMHPGTFAEAQARIDEALQFLGSQSPTALDTREPAEVELALPIGLTFDLTGTQYARAKFYFHVMTAYAILRHHGIALGKADYVSHMFMHLRSMPEIEAESQAVSTAIAPVPPSPWTCSGVHRATSAAR